MKSPLFAAIDLGSNSFHLLVVKASGGHVQTLAKVKRKVRLAAGLDSHYQLDDAAMQRGWECLALFAERLRDIPAGQVKVVATATLRFARNAERFLVHAEQLLGHPITVITGEQEAELIYQGVAQTCGQPGRRLVVDIGGASTELIIGEGAQALALTSLEMGCVTFQEQFFADGQLTAGAFARAIAAARQRLQGISDTYRQLGWQHCVGASGSVQAVQEVQLARGEDETVTLARLRQTQADTIACKNLTALTLNGLSEERKPVFVAGLAILLAIFEELSVTSMEASGGALREGVIYSLLPIVSADVRSRTLAALEERFSLDANHGRRVADTAVRLVADAEADSGVLVAAARLHELGLAVGFKGASDHGAYLVSHLDLPGFSAPERRQMVTLVGHQQGPLPDILSPEVLALRLAVLLCGERQAPPASATVHWPEAQQLQLQLPADWLATRPLMQALLQEEQQTLAAAGWQLLVEPQP
ncbi:guanosine-5'-triphosphate,3'-diphosphate pyrophosphatase [Gallaecimonas sp. GXIMD1310]|uniref:Ppx/GppA phosphatase family protein n=1 Tax=Gallaecimonas sp. GXIMD1310 TaxID=3131926 RepID=UPI00324FE123